MKRTLFALALLAAATSISHAGAVSDIPLNRQVVLHVSESSWTPSTGQSRESLPIIQAYLEKSTEEKNVTAVVGVKSKTRRDWIASSVNAILKNKDGYRVQFWGVDYNGHKVIYCNFFPASPRSNNDAADEFNHWRKDEVEVDDGGYFYFQVTYDPKLKKVVLFDCNGVACVPCNTRRDGVQVVTFAFMPDLSPLYNLPPR